MRKRDKTKELLEQLILDLREQQLVRYCIQKGISFLLAGDGVFLGKIIDAHDSDSILNRDSTYGNVGSNVSIFNDSCPYGGKTGRYSPFNPESNEPPLLFVKGEYWGVVSDNSRIDEKSVPVRKFLDAIVHDWRAVERGELSDSGSIRVPVHP